MQSKRGNTIKKQAKPDDPAIALSRPGNDVVKNQSELQVDEKASGEKASGEKAGEEKTDNDNDDDDDNSADKDGGKEDGKAGDDEKKATTNGASP